jgi:hypothetical protein
MKGSMVMSTATQSTGENDRREKITRILQAHIDKKKKEHEQMMKDIPAVAQTIVDLVLKGRIKVPDSYGRNRRS